jgi:integrase
MNRPTLGILISEQPEPQHKARMFPLVMTEPSRGLDPHERSATPRSTAGVTTPMHDRQKTRPYTGREAKSAYREPAAPLSQELVSFNLHLRRKGLADTTVHQYLRAMNHLLRMTDLDKAEEYLLSLVESGHKGNYVNNYVHVLHAYGQFAGRDDLQKIQQFRAKSAAKAIMEEQEITDFLALEPPRHVMGMFLWHYHKMSLYWKCLAYTGARTNEIATLQVKHVDFGRGVFLVDGKTGPRNVPISHAVIDDLKRHIADLHSDHLFPSLHDRSRPIGRATWNFDFHNRIRRLGIRRPNLTPYSLRHSFITRNWDMGLPSLQKIVGHKRIETTAHYTHLVTKDIVTAINKDPLVRGNLSGQDQVLLAREILEKSGFVVTSMHPRADGGFSLEVYVK